MWPKMLSPGRNDAVKSSFNHEWTRPNNEYHLRKSVLIRVHPGLH
jgi:hypothetical protein